MLSLLLFISIAVAQQFTCSEHSRPNITEPIIIGKPLPFINIKVPNNIHQEKLDPYEIDFKILILSATNNISEDPGTDLIKKSLNNYNIPYDHIALTENGKRISESPLPLTNPDGSGKYYGVILSSNQLIFKNEKGVLESSLTISQWSHLEKYESDYGVRRVSVYSFPHSGLGVSQTEGMLSPDEMMITLNKNELNLDLMGLRKEIQIPSPMVWFYPTEIKDAHIATPILYFENNGKQTIGGIINNFLDGRKQMHFFFSQNANSLPSILLSAIWINWVTKGIYQGQRRLYFNIQVDDFFLSTRLWYPQKVDIYRSQPDDIIGFLNWQKIFLQPLVNNQNYKIELAFNGWGVKDSGGMSADLLFIYSKNQIEQFNWVSHTYSHPNLDSINFETADTDLKLNIDFANIFFGQLITQYFSPQSLITPGISGLLNKDALKAMVNNNIVYVIGDNSRPELVGDQIHHGRYTTEEFNGLSGVLIIPRYPTQIYFNVSNPKELVSQYNTYYPQYNGKANFEQIIDLETKRVSKILYSFDHAPHMFHQANLRIFDYENQKISLLSYWMQKIVNEIRKYLSLPILSTKMDQLAVLYKERMDLKNCDVISKMVIDNQQVIRIKIKAAKSCKVGFTGIDPVIEPGITIESYGPDQTVYINPANTSMINLKRK